MRPGRAADHSPPSSAAVMEEYSYTSTHHLGQTGPVIGITFTVLPVLSSTKRHGVWLCKHTSVPVPVAARFKA